MSRAYVIHTNQTLSAAKLFVEQYQQLDLESNALMGKVAKQATLSAALGQLVRSLDAYLKELAFELLDLDPKVAVVQAANVEAASASVQVLLAPGTDIEQIWVLLEAKNSMHSSWRQVVVLQQNEQSWLNGMLNGYGQTWWPTAQADTLVETAGGAVGQIQLVDVSNGPKKLAAIDAKTLSGWCSELEAMIELHRQSLQEW